MYRILIVEDDDTAADLLRRHIDRYATEKGLELQVRRISSALGFAAERNEADLVFLDIELPGFTGLEVADLLRAYDDETPIIFVTNLSQYAMEGYRVHAVDFIIKPVRYFDLSMAMDRALRYMRRTSHRTIPVQTQDGIHVIWVGDITLIESSGHNVTYRLVDGSSFVTRATLKSVEATLADEPFVRISKSCLANLTQLKTVTTEGVTLADGQTAYFGRTKKKEALEKITRFLGGVD